jgi:hypothetical protein
VPWTAKLPEVELRVPSRQDVIVEMHLAVAEAFAFYEQGDNNSLLELVDVV